MGSFGGPQVPCQGIEDWLEFGLLRRKDRMYLGEPHNQKLRDRNEIEGWEESRTDFSLRTWLIKS